MLKDQVAIITGSSQGIGAGLAKYFAQQGAIVVVNFPFDSEAEKAKMLLLKLQIMMEKPLPLKQMLLMKQK